MVATSSSKEQQTYFLRVVEYYRLNLPCIGKVTNEPRNV